MSTHVKVFIAILVLGTLGIVGAKFALPLVRDAIQRQTSDASGTRGTIRIGVDNWVGYFPLCSPENTRRLRHAGYVLNCEDDQADYAQRFARLEKGELDLAVATVDAYLLNGAKLSYPGAIVAVLDESKGGDAIVARKTFATTVEALRRKSEVRVAFTPASPSAHLLKSIGAHFDLPLFLQRRGAWRVEAEGSSDALAKLQAGKADVAVLWEPDVTRALADGAFVKLIGTEDTEKLIVDVLIASRRVLQEKPEAVQTLLDQYFQALAHYREEPQRLAADLKQATGLPAAQVESMMRGVAWASLTDNGAHWFGVTPSGLPAEEGLVDAIGSAVGVLTAAGDFDRNPLPDGDAYRITNRQFVSELYLPQIAGPAGQGGDTLARSFNALDDQGWAKLKEVGTLKVEPIGFQRGTAALDEDSRAVLDRMAQRLRHYPKFRIVVKGHTGISGDKDANLALSLARAEAVANYLRSTWRIDDNRIRALGYGGSQPLPREPDESDRVYGYRLPRVEIALVAEGY